MALEVVMPDEVIGWLSREEILNRFKEVGPQAPVKVTCVKPLNLPMTVMRGVAEGIHPTFSREFIRHSKARMEMYKNSPANMTPEEQTKLLDELCEGIGSVATGMDNPPRKRKQPVFRSIDESWEGQ